MAIYNDMAQKIVKCYSLKQQTRTDIVTRDDGSRECCLKEKSETVTCREQSLLTSQSQIIQPSL